MKAVLKERLDSLADGVRQALRGGQIFYQTLEPQPDQNRVLLRLRDASKTDAAVAALKPLISPDASTGQPDMAIGSDPDGTITLTLSAPALAARAAGAVDQSIEIVRRRIDETGVVDPQITRQGQNRIVVQLPGVGDPDRIKQLIGKTAHMTFRLVDEAANPAVRRTAAAGRRIPADAGQPEPEDRRSQADRRRRGRPDRRARRHQSGNRRVGGELHLQLGRRPTLRRCQPSKREPPVRDRAGRQGDFRPGHPRGDHRRAGPDQRLVQRPIRQRPVGAAARRRVAGAADGGGGTLRRAGTGRRQHPRRRDFAGRRVPVRHRLHGDSSTACSAGSRTWPWWSTCC